MMGFGPNDNFDAVKTAHEADMKRFGGVISDETRRFYRDRARSGVHKERETQPAARRKPRIRTRSSPADAGGRRGKRKADRGIPDTKNKQLDEENAQANAASSTEHIAEMDETKQELLANLDTQRTELEGQIAERDTNIKNLDSRDGRAEAANRNPAGAGSQAIRRASKSPTAGSPGSIRTARCGSMSARPMRFAAR